jgi:hypothetical protein
MKNVCSILNDQTANIVKEQNRCWLWKLYGTHERNKQSDADKDT